MVEERWICDKCKEPIMKAEEGWFKWTKNLNDGTFSDFKIIHYPVCNQPGPKIQRTTLTTPGDLVEEFLGKDGLIRLLELMSKTKPENQPDLLDAIQRLQIPGYETARAHFDDAHKKAKLVPAIDGVYYLTTKQIQEINEQYN